MRHRKHSPQLDYAETFWAVEVKLEKSSAWEPYPLIGRQTDKPFLDGMKWIAIKRKRARQLASDLRRSQDFYAVRAIKLQRITRA